MIHLVYHLDGGNGRAPAVDRMLDGVMNLPRDKRFVVDVSEWREPLPHNYLARLKIPVRQLAAFNGLTYEEMNEIVHDRFYPKTTKTVGGVTYEVTVPTNRLTPLEARKIEADLHTLAGEIGCQLSYPTGNSDL
jgi:hypothetical protein